MGRIGSFILAALLSITALADTVVHDAGFQPDHVLHVTQQDIQVACQSRRSIVVNGTSPGPALHLAPGQQSWIRVYNDMTDENLTMHWHGLAQRMSPFSDGTPQAAQWPIPPGHFFDYEIDTALTDAGTYFYHSHIGMQALTCSGAIIVDDCKPPYDYDDERILHFGDFYREEDLEITTGLQNVPLKFPGGSNAFLLNGVGIPHADDGGGDEDKQPQSGNEVADQPSRRRQVGDQASGQADASTGCMLPVVNVEAGKTYRFRFIGSTGISHLSMGFEGHQNMTIIQVDGNEYNKPMSTSYLQLGSGQRFDVLFTTKTAEQLTMEGRSSYWLQFETRDAPQTFRAYAVLQYGEQSLLPNLPPAMPPLSFPEITYDWMEYAFTPLNETANDCPNLSEVTRRVVIDASLVVSPSSGRTVYRLGGLDWTEHTYKTPMLVDIYKYGDAAVPSWDAAQENYGWDPITRAWPAKLGEVLEIVIQNLGAQTTVRQGSLDIHPFHVHGAHAYDIGSGSGRYDAEANEKKMVDMGYKAVRRDTTMLYRYQISTEPGAVDGWRAWRVRVTDPGVWLIHCHTLPHMIMGMQMVWVNGGAEDIRKIPIEQSLGYLNYGGDVYGNVTHNPTYYKLTQHLPQCIQAS